jgi:hypothetical protein
MKRVFPFLIFTTSLLLLSGCGAKYVPVEGVVTIDGKTVPGATVTFVSDDGKQMSSGTTDDGGNFTLTSGANPGALPGNYKVTVTKYPKVDGYVPSGDSAADKDYMKHMKKEMDGSKAVAPKVTGPKTGGIAPPSGMMMPGGGGAGRSGVKSELPENYSLIEKTPLTVKVPSEGPVKLELKSK